MQRNTYDCSEPPLSTSFVYTCYFAIKQCSLSAATGRIHTAQPIPAFCQAAHMWVHIQGAQGFFGVVALTQERRENICRQHTQSHTLKNTRQNAACEPPCCCHHGTSFVHAYQSSEIVSVNPEVVSVCESTAAPTPIMLAPLQ